MSYLVLARKWRPQTFEDLIGQEHVSRTLANAIQSDRVHHAFLFTGARGVGKTSAARILAKALNCDQGPTATPCNECPACREISAGQGGDVFEIDGASNTGVDDVRDLRENIRYLPSRSPYKIFIIDEVHMLSINAFNALLKTLEEPPPHAKFILATTEPHKIPHTIHSRCQRFDFRKIPLVRTVARLRQIVDAEQVRVSDAALTLVARRGEGSMRDALSTLDQVIAFCGMEVSDEDVQGLLGMVDRRLLLDTVEGFLQRDSHRALEAVRRVDTLGFSYRPFCQELVELVRALLVLQVVPEPGDLLDLTPDQVKELRAVGEGASVEDLERALTLLIRTEAELPAASNPRLTLEMALIRLALLPPGRDVGALVRKLEELEKRLGGASFPPPQPTPGPGRAPVRQPPQASAPATPPPPPEPPEPQAISSAPAVAATAGGAPQAAPGSSDWPGFVEFVKGERPLDGALLDHARVLKFVLPDLVLGFQAGSFHLRKIKEEEALARLTALAETFYRTKVRLKVEACQGDAPAGPSLAEQREAEQLSQRRQLEDAAQGDPVVQAALEVFGGTVREVRALNGGETPDESDETPSASS